MRVQTVFQVFGISLPKQRDDGDIINEEEIALEPRYRAAAASFDMSFDFVDNFCPWFLKTLFLLCTLVPSQTHTHKNSTTN